MYIFKKEREVSIRWRQPVTTLLLRHLALRSSAWLGRKRNKTFLCLPHLNTYIADPTSACGGGGEVRTMIKPSGLPSGRQNWIQFLALYLVVWQWASYSPGWGQIRLSQQCLEHSKNWINYCYYISVTWTGTLFFKSKLSLEGSIWRIK